MQNTPLESALVIPGRRALLIDCIDREKVNNNLNTFNDVGGTTLSISIVFAFPVAFSSAPVPLSLALLTLSPHRAMSCMVATHRRYHTESEPGGEQQRANDFQI